MAIEVPMNSLPPESKREQAKAKTRKALLKSALRLYSKEGAKGMSMNKVAKGAGIAQPSFYNHFASLAALEVELSEQLKENYLAPLRNSWINLMGNFDTLKQEKTFDDRCQHCLSMIFDAAFLNIELFQHLVEDRPRVMPSATGQSSHGLGNLITEIQHEWSDIFIQGLKLSGRSFHTSQVNLCVDMAAAQVHELILGCHQQRYTREQAIAILCTSFNALFMRLFSLNN